MASVVLADNLILGVGVDNGVLGVWVDNGALGVWVDDGALGVWVGKIVSGQMQTAIKRICKR